LHCTASEQPNYGRDAVKILGGVSYPPGMAHLDPAFQLSALRQLTGQLDKFVNLTR